MLQQRPNNFVLTTEIWSKLSIRRKCLSYHNWRCNNVQFTTSF